MPVRVERLERGLESLSELSLRRLAGLDVDATGGSSTRGVSALRLPLSTVGAGAGGSSCVVPGA